MTPVFKHIKKTEDLKIDYLYEVKDEYWSFKLLLLEIYPALKGIILDTKTEFLYSDLVSNVISTSPEFNKARYQFNEIGPKEDHPEYLL